MKNPWLKKKEKKYSMVLGHRGAMGLAPENTLASMNEALLYHVDILEIDVHLSKDNQLIVMHDETVDRTTDGKGYIHELTSSYIKTLDAGVKFSKKFRYSRVPFLEEILDLIKNEEVRLNIELKNGPIFYHGIEERIIKAIDRYDFYDKVLVSSFDHQALQRLKKINPSVSIAMLYSNNMLHLEDYALKLGVSAVHPHHFWVTSEVVQQMHRLNMAVNTWVINSKNEFLRFSRMGVDAVGTNFPNLFSAG